MINTQLLCCNALYEVLLTHYGGSHSLFKTKQTSTYYRNTNAAYELFKGVKKYDCANMVFLIFLVLFSHNTTDKQTQKLFFIIKNSNVLQSFRKTGDHSLFSAYYYKKAEFYKQAQTQVYQYLRHAFCNNVPVTMGQLLKIKGIGHKSAALLMNHFFQPNSEPVVDVNVFNAFKILAAHRVPSVKTPTDLHHLLKLHAQMQGVVHISLCDLLWLHRKTCRTNGSCAERSKPACGVCQSLKKKMVDFYESYNFTNAINK